MFPFLRNTFLLVMWLINERGVENVEFNHVKCVEDDQRRIVCEDVPLDLVLLHLIVFQPVLVKTDGFIFIVKVDRRRPSRWPSGSYALPMTIYGCPETWAQGWMKVSVTFEWDTPQAVLTTAVNMSSPDRINHYRDVIKDHWPGFRSNVFGSFGDLNFKLNFCYKHNTSDSETNSWPAGSYSIFRVGGNCPKGFKEHEQNVLLTNVSRWYYDSYRPDFETEQRDDSTLLRIYLCARDHISTEEHVDEFHFLPASDFMLIKNTDTDCPVLLNSTAKEESLFIGRREKSEILEPVLFETFCFYTSATLKDSNYAERLLDTKNKKGFIISTTLISEGYHSVEPDSRLDDNQDILQMLDNNKGSRIMVPWKLIDLGRTLPVSALDLQFLSDVGGHLVDGKNIFICFISDIKWSFLHFDAFYCTYRSIYKTSVRTLHLLFNRMLHGRFISLVDDSTHKKLLEQTVKIQVFTHLYSSEDEHATSCNSDIGMTDGSILDFQISASSYHWKYPPKNARPLLSGWCAASTDTAPFIMVDLLEVVQVDGITIANWEEHVYINNVDKLYQFGTRTFKVSHGTSREQLKNLTEFHLDAARPVNESQTALFVKPFKARFVTVWIIRGLVESLNCLRLELHGCKLSAIPSLNCKTGGYMFDQLSALPLSVSRPVSLEKVSSFIECKNRCRELDECSSVVFEGNVSISCSMYPRDTSDRWNLLVNNDTIVQTSTKLCWDQSLAVAKSLYKIDVSTKTTLSQVSMINNETIVSSIGYPFSYGGDQTYRWIVMLEDKNYIKLIFTNISFHQYMEDGSGCSDSLSISKGLIRERNASRDITSRFNGQIFVIETSESSVVLTFRSCFPALSLEKQGYGFRTIITKQSIPACFSLTSDMSWEVGRFEICTQETMLITSMSLLGLPFEGTNEEWKLHFPRYRIQLQILQFQVECKIDGKGSEFYIKDLDSKRSYCNLKMPPSKITLSSDSVTINFYNSRQPRDRVYSEGFVLKYEITYSSKEFMLYGTKYHSTVLNVALGKPTHGSSNYVVGRAGYSNDATDGITHADMMYGSCFHSAFENNPWFVIDLQGIYLLYWTELNMRMDCCDIRHKNAEISTGLELNDMSVAGFICGRFGAVKAVDMHNRIARYVKLELIYGGNFINLCEMQVFGHLVKEIDASDLSFEKPEPVDGQWGIWGPWSAICFCNGSQPRRRVCDSPSPYFSGRSCDGTDTSFRVCSPGVQCEVRNVALRQSAGMSSQYLLHEANAGIDGDSSQNMSTCFHTQREYQPWWMVDLHDAYHLHHLVMYDLITNATRTRSIEVTAGLTLCEMRTAYFKCGEPMFHSVKTVDMIGIIARFVKLQMMGIKEYFHLCEVEIFGQRARQTTNKTCEDKKSVDGNWSAWSPWSTCSEHCGTGNKTRTRTCTNPAPTSGGKLCVGDSIDLLSCKEYKNCPCENCSGHFEKCYHLFPMLTNWRYAGEECWHRGMQLVSIRSESELRFIKFLLREDRYKNNQPLPTNPNLVVHINAGYFTHIGLHRSFRNDYGIFVDLWEDNSPATFLAWGKSQPAPGKNCTRMDFRLYDQSNSWETEDCEAQLAEYFVCEQLINSASVVDTKYLPQKHNWVMIPDQLPVSEYLGKENRTTSGLSCTPWASDDRQLQPYDLQYSTYVHNNFLDDTMFPDGSIAAAENFCRDPSNDRYLWCYTKEDAIKWEECSVQLPFKNDTFDGYFKYTGTLSKTYSGKTCQSWDTKSPHANYAHLYFFPGESLATVSNYCRDPWHNGYLWCYTMDQAARWEPCVLEDSKEDGCGNVFVKYDRQISHTVTGKPCDFWKKHHISFTTKSFVQENTCQDPLNQGFLWCYISDGSWEPCDLDETQINPEKGPGSLKHEDYSGVFTCDTGQNISQFKECNAVFDCPDLSDETGCWNTIKSHPLFAEVELSSDLPISFEIGSYFQCNSSLEWISVTAYCDGVIDCLDTSDESYCSKLSNDKMSCLPDQFQCAEGDCIHISQLCNFVFDCIDHSDENCDFGPCSDAEFRCNNKQCIPINKRCDSRRDCSDGSDEDLCDSCVADKAYHCDVVKCISLRLRCNNYIDCEDQTDEKLCDIKDFISCVQWYEAGHTSSGVYFVGGMEVFCDFDSVHLGKMYTIIENREIVLDKTCCAETWMFLLSNLEEGKDDYLVWDIITRPEYMCTQEIKQTCLTVHATAAEFDDSAFSHSFQHCDCVILEAHINRNKVFEKQCSVHQNMSEDNIELSASRNSKLSFRYSEVMIYRQMEYLGTPNKYIQYFPGPIVCEHEYIRNDEVVTCETGLKCVYDVDETGIILGCRNGSHLENCEAFVCPQNTVKCPGSYCIPIRFVCDGVVQCPGGQDENNCGCAEESEILILYDADGFQDDTFIEKFASQFYTGKGNVRLMSYTASQPLQEDFSIKHVVMHIIETQISPFTAVNRLPNYQYKLKAKRFLRDIIFLKNDTTKRGMIFLENSEIAGTVAGQMFININGTLPSGVKLYRITADPIIFPNNLSNKYEHVQDVKLKRWRVLSSQGLFFFPELCAVSSKVLCGDAYKCSWSRNCIPLHQVCDGFIQCPHGDDERLCNFRCPKTCSCRGYAVLCSNKNIQLNDINNISKSTRQLDLSSNKDLMNVFERSHLKIQSLVRLNVSMCSIEVISDDAFRGLRNLISLDLSYNSIGILSADVFIELKYLKRLELKGNYKLSILQSGAFNGLGMIRELDLANAQLKTVEQNTFSGLNLEKLDLSNNSIREIKALAFSDLSVNILNFKDNEILNFNKEIFTGVASLQELISPAFKFCCIRPNYLEEEDCYPSKDEFSSCEDLMRLSALQTMLWLIGLSALVGNALSILYRLVYDRERLKIGFGIFVTNLAVADFLMGVYLIIIAIADAAFRKRYIFMDDYWRNSVWCNLAGFLSTVSSEASVLFLCLITLDRLLVIKFPFGEVRFNRKRAVVSSSVSWGFSIVFAVIPLVFTGYFQNKFYTKSGVCIALPLTRDRPAGWMYSVAIFVGLNFITFVLVAFGQIAIFVEIRNAKIGQDVQRARNQDLKIARNLLLVVTTDFLCWFPIGVMGMMALSGHVISGDVYAWAAVFILPVNSALNPILYTLSAILGQKKFNPDTNEQNRPEVTADIGERSLAILDISERLNVRRALRRGKYHKIYDILEKDVCISTPTLLKIGKHLAQILDVLHSNYLVTKQLDVHTVYISMKGDKIDGRVVLDDQPSLSTKAEDLANDVFLFGVILRVLMKKACVK